MPDLYDIFLSYPSADRAPATALNAALEMLGLSVWMDTERIDDADSILRCIDTGLARSRVLVAWYSKSYAQSRACQWELKAALIVSQFETLAARRVLVINPERGTAHIVQTMVRNVELIPAAAAEPVGDLAERLKTAGAQAQGLLDDIRRLARPPWHGQKKGLGSKCFVGRLGELWQVQNALTSGRFAIVAGQPRLKAARDGDPANDSPVYQLLDGFPDIQRLKTGVFRDRVRYAEALKRRLAEARHRKDADAAVVVDLENTLLQAAGKQGGTCG